MAATAASAHQSLSGMWGSGMRKRIGNMVGVALRLPENGGACTPRIDPQSGVPFGPSAAQEAGPQSRVPFGPSAAHEAGPQSGVPFGPSAAQDAGPQSGVPFG